MQTQMTPEAAAVIEAAKEWKETGNFDCNEINLKLYKTIVDFEAIENIN